MTRHRSTVIAGLLALVAVPLLSAQDAKPALGLTMPDSALKFEAASIRQNKTGGFGSSSQTGNGRVTVRNSPVRQLLRNALHVQAAQIIGGPGWLSTDAFDIVAKAPAGTSDADLYGMLVNFLVERLAVKAHVETRTMSVYTLGLARSDGKFGPDFVADPCPTHPCANPFPSAPAGATGGGSGGGVLTTSVAGGGGGGGVSGGAGAGKGPNMSATGMTMDQMVQMFSGSVDRTVINQTGLVGRYNMKLRYTPPGSPSDGSPDAAPDLFTALQEQLGLKLQSARMPIGVLVIDGADHPVNDDFTIADPATGR